jgi:hypothetical protein
LLAGLVNLGNSSRTNTYEPLLSRRYGFILLGRYVVELEPNETLRLVTFKFYVENAVGLLQQVGWSTKLLPVLTPTFITPLSSLLFVISLQVATVINRTLEKHFALLAALRVALSCRDVRTGLRCAGAAEVMEKQARCRWSNRRAVAP